MPRNPKQQPTYTSRRRRFCRNILTVCFLSKQNTFMATKIKSRDTLLPLDDFRSHSKHTRSAAQFLKRAQSTHVTFRESVLARVSLGIARLCGDTITLPSGMNTVACVPAHPGIKPSLPRTSLCSCDLLPRFSLHLTVKRRSSNRDGGFQVALLGGGGGHRQISIKTYILPTP